MNNSAEQTFQKMTAGIIREYVRSLLYIDDEWPDLAEISEKGEPDESELIPEIDAEDIDVSAGQDGKGMFGEPAFKPEAGTKSGSSISSAGRKDQDFEAKPKKLRATLRGDASLLEFERAVKKEGILFSGITYRKKEHHNLVVDLASRADIVVLDWELASDDGLEAIWILQQLIGMGLRFICIFTQKERLHEIMKHIKKELGVKLPEQREPSGDSAIPEEGPLEFKIENLVIAIRKKRSATSDVNSEFIVEPCTLLDEAIKAMAKVYKGFIQLVMLEITNAHRQYLPNILDRFDPDLDPAFLAEFTDEDSPISRSDAFIGILLDECRAHLKKARSKLLNSDGIKAYSKSFMPNIEELNEPLIRDCLLERLTVQKATANKLVSWATKDCFGEIKNWLESGCPEIAVIQSDDERKRKIKLRRPELLLAMNPKAPPGL